MDLSSTAIMLDAGCHANVIMGRLACGGWCPVCLRASPLFAPYLIIIFMLSYFGGHE